MRTIFYMLIMFLAGCASAGKYDSPIAKKVAIEIENMQKPETQMEAYSKLENMGKEAAPYIIGQLDNANKLPNNYIGLTNNWPGAFEGIRHYSPEVVQDALAAILDQLTGQSFGFIYNGSTLSERKKNLHGWREWCVKNHPKLKQVCLGEST